MNEKKLQSLEDRIEFLHKTVVETSMNVDCLHRAMESLAAICEGVSKINKSQIEQISNLIQRVEELENTVDHD